MLSREFPCPSCGAPVEKRFDQSKSLCCTFCGQTSHLLADNLQMVGEKQLLIDFGSMFQLGKQITIGKLKLMLLGRIRLDYEDGFWDEWFAQSLDEGKTWWLQEDDGQFTLFRKKANLDRSLDFDQIEVGSSIKIPDVKGEVFITSKSKASVNGGEGELPFKIIPGEPADFADGIWKGKPVSMELLPDERALYIGQVVPLNMLIAPTSTE